MDGINHTNVWNSDNDLVNTLYIDGIPLDYEFPEKISIDLINLSYRLTESSSDINFENSDIRYNINFTNE